MTTALAVAAAVFAALLAMLGMAWWRQEQIVFQPPRAHVKEPRDVRRVEYGASDGTALFAYVVGSSRGDARSEARSWDTAGMHGPSRAPHSTHPLTERSSELVDTRDQTVPVGDAARARGAVLASGAPRARAASPTGALVIAFHGNADLAVWLVPWAREVAARTGWTVMLPELRGYAGLGGTPTYEASQLDARAAYACARDVLEADPAHIALYGHSLGSGIAAELACDLDAPPAALVLQSPFTSARDMARRIVLLPLAGIWRLITRVHFDTERIVSALDVRVSVAHGERDLIVPVRMGRRVHAAARVRGPLLLVSHAGHNDVSEVAGDEYWKWLNSALGSQRSTLTRPTPPSTTARSSLQ